MYSLPRLLLDPAGHRGWAKALGGKIKKSLPCIAGLQNKGSPRWNSSSSHYLVGPCARGRSRCLPYPLHGKDGLKGRVKFSSHIGMIPGLLLAAYPSPHLCTHCHPLDFLRQLGLHLKLESLQRYAASWPTGSGHYPSIGLKLVSAGPVPARRKPAAASWFDKPGPGQAAGLGRARSRAAGPVCCKPSAASDSSCLVRGRQEARLRRVPSTAWCLQGAAHLRDPS